MRLRLRRVNMKDMKSTDFYLVAKQGIEGAPERAFILESQEEDYSDWEPVETFEPPDF